jgi:hypothetical protein
MRKIILYPLIALAVIIVGIALFYYLPTTGNRIDPSEQTLTINPADQACQADDDCVMAMVKCSCDCGVPINKLNWPKYLDQQARMCENYNGRMCKMGCNQVLKCVDNICAVLM